MKFKRRKSIVQSPKEISKHNTSSHNSTKSMAISRDELEILIGSLSKKEIQLGKFFHQLTSGRVILKSISVPKKAENPSSNSAKAEDVNVENIANVSNFIMPCKIENLSPTKSGNADYKSEKEVSDFKFSKPIEVKKPFTRRSGRLADLPGKRRKTISNDEIKQEDQDVSKSSKRQKSGDPKIEEVQNNAKNNIDEDSLTVEKTKPVSKNSLNSSKKLKTEIESKNVHEKQQRKQLKCNFCSYKANNFSNIRVHRRKIHGIGKF